MPPFQTRTTTIAVASWEGGVRAYTQSGDGDIREGCNTSELSHVTWRNPFAGHSLPFPWMFPRNFAPPYPVGPQIQNDNWTAGSCHGTSDRGSTLCSLSWSEGPKYRCSLFFQAPDRSIRELSHDEGKWNLTGFVETNCMPGTDIAEVHSSNADRVMIFFQGADGQLRSRRARNWQWEPSVVICSAATVTGIASTTWDDTANIRVYYQDQTNILRERGGNFDGGWWIGQFTCPADRPLGTMAAVSWSGAPEIRIYMQDLDNKLVEWCYTNLNWVKGFTHDAAPNTDLAAILRSPEGPYINLLWAGQDRVLRQLVYGPEKGWEPDAPLGFLAATGVWAGSCAGTHFSDNDSAADSRKIRKIMIRSGAIIDGIGIEFADGTSTPWRGGQGGLPHEFVLQDGANQISEVMVIACVLMFPLGFPLREDITQVLATDDGNNITQLAFITSKGHRSEKYGNNDGTQNLLEYEGKALAGFSGATGQYLNGIQPLWSDRDSSISPAELTKMIDEATAMGIAIDAGVARDNDLRNQVANLKNDLLNGLRAPAEEAIKGVNILAASVQELAVAMGDTKALVAKCKAQSIVVSDRFEAVHDKAAEYLKSSTQLATEISYQASQVHTKMHRISEIAEIAGGMKTNTEVMLQIRNERVADATAHIEVANRTKEEAERNKHDAENTRIVRDIFTFGLGEIGDWGSLNEAIDYANKLIDSANANLEACNTTRTMAQNSVIRITAEIARFDGLSAKLDSYGPTLNQESQRMSELLALNRDVENQALTTSMFLSEVAGKTGVLSVQHTAQKLATSVLSIQEMLGTNSKLAGTLATNAGSLDAALQAIASSPVSPSPTSDM